MLTNNEKKENQQDTMNRNILVDQSTENHPENIVRLMRMMCIYVHY